MKLDDIIAELRLESRVETRTASRDVAGGYVSDLLSDVMANAHKDDIWVTSQTHQNIVAVASLLELAAVVLVGGLQPDEDTLSKADSHGVIILTTDKSAFDVVGQLYKLGIRGGVDEP